MWMRIRSSHGWWQVACLGDQIPRKHMAKMERQEDRRGEYGQEQSRSGGENECVLECVHERYPEEVPFIHTSHIR